MENKCMISGILIKDADKTVYPPSEIDGKSLPVTDKEGKLICHATAKYVGNDIWIDFPAMIFDEMSKKHSYSVSFKELQNSFKTA